MTDGRMRIGVVLPIAQEEADGVPAYASSGRSRVAAEAGGFDSVWVFDHLLFRFDGEETGIHECWTILPRSPRRLAGRARDARHVHRRSATPRCWPRWPPRSTTSAAAG